MGGSVGKIAGDVGRGVSGVLTLGGSEIARNNLGVRNPISQALGLPGTIATGGLSGQSQIPSIFGYAGQENPYISGPFSLDQAQLTADQNAILGLGKKQYDETLSEIPKSVGNAINLQIPDIEEKLNGQHLMNSTALQQAIAQQQAQLTSQLAIPALENLHGVQQSALGRGLSLEDFINQANVAKTIGAQTSPQVGNGKGQTGTLLSGVGALAPLVKNVGKAGATAAV